MGKVDDDPVGTFRYLKNENNQEQTVTAFLLEFEHAEPVIQSFRNPTWFPVDKALEALAEDRGDRYAEEFRSLIEKAVGRVGVGARAAGGGRT